MIFIVLGMAIGPGIYAHGIEPYADTLLLLTGYVLGCITGVIIYHSGIDVEERENEDFKYQDNVFEHYLGAMSGIDHDGREDEAVNKTAIHFDTSPSAVRNIVKVYNDD